MPLPLRPNLRYRTESAFGGTPNGEWAFGPDAMQERHRLRRRLPAPNLRYRTESAFGGLPNA
jgi:hypothetical protein